MEEENSRYMRWKDTEKENSRHMRWKQTTKALLGAVRNETCHPCCIPVVPDDLRKWNESAYMPKVVSIGPLYRGRRELSPTEELKWRCVMSLLSRTFGLDALEMCVEAVIELDAAVRASYSDEIKLDSYTLATTMVFDGLFLLELLICESNLDSEIPIPFNGISPGIEVKNMEYVITDLMLLENQIPIFILETLFEKLLGSSSQMRELMQILALNLFGFSGILMVQSTFHFLDIAHSYFEMGWIDKKIEENEVRINLFTIDSTKPTMQRQHLNRCAMRLEAAGITIQPLKNDDDSEHINFKSSTDFNKSNGILRINKLIITKTTEVSWRNFIAWEHHKKKLKSSSFSVADTHSICTFTALLFKDLICCTSDVQWLKDRGVLIDCTGKSNRDLMAFFNSIAGGVDRSIIDHKHKDMFQSLNKISSKNYIIKIFILLYHSFCKTIDWLCYDSYRFAATMLTFMGIVQTFYTILAYHLPSKVEHVVLKRRSRKDRKLEPEVPRRFVGLSLYAT